MRKLEIFKPGTHTAQSGEKLDFGEQRLRESAEAYDPQLHEAPIVVGHPKNDAPAYGWIRSLSFSEGRLEAEPEQVDPQFAELVSEGKYKKVSASFYRPNSENNPKPGVYYLRHVGFLGAQPPSVKGLKGVQFSEDDDAVTVEFGETERSLARVLRGLREWIIELVGTRRADEVIPNYEINELERQDKENGQAEPEMAEPGGKSKQEGSKVSTDKTKEEVRKELEAEFAEREKQLAERERQRRREELSKDVDELVNQGKVLPRHKENLVQFMEAVDGSEEQVEFSEGDGDRKKVAPAEWLKKFLSDLPQAVDYSERAPGGDEDPAGSVEAPDGYSVDPEKAKLHKQALEYQEKNDVDYVTAVQAVARKSKGGE
jgi:hypothetical protein